MTNFEPCSFNEWIVKNQKRQVSLILAAGFESRAKTSLSIIGTNPAIELVGALVFDYENQKANEPTRTEILKSLEDKLGNFNLIGMHDVHSLSDYVREQENLNRAVLVDITGMSRVWIFQILHEMFNSKVPFHLIYTEADSYQPDQKFFDILSKQIKQNDNIFDIYQEIEKKEIVYSYDCEVISPSEFLGYPEPGRPAILIGFLTYKRSRLQCILRSFEFSARLLIITNPIREDLRWRRRLLELLNLDILESRPPKKAYLPTLNPFIVSEYLEREIFMNSLCRNSNVYLAPLGSKTQTVGCYFFWRRNSDVSVIFSQPSKYYPDKYSEGSRDTFLFSYEQMFDHLGREFNSFSGDTIFKN